MLSRFTNPPPKALLMIRTDAMPVAEDQPFQLYWQSAVTLAISESIRLPMRSRNSTVTVFPVGLPAAHEFVPKYPPNWVASVSNVNSAAPPALPKSRLPECGKIVHMKPQLPVMCIVAWPVGEQRSAVLLKTRFAMHRTNGGFVG